MSNTESQTNTNLMNPTNEKTKYSLCDTNKNNCESGYKCVVLDFKCKQENDDNLEQYEQNEPNEPNEYYEYYEQDEQNEQDEEDEQDEQDEQDEEDKEDELVNHDEEDEEDKEDDEDTEDTEDESIENDKDYNKMVCKNDTYTNWCYVFLFNLLVLSLVSLFTSFFTVSTIGNIVYNFIVSLF